EAVTPSDRALTAPRGIPADLIKDPKSYEGKDVVLAGIIQRVDQGNDGTWYFMLRDRSADDNWRNPFKDVACYFTKADNPVISQLKPTTIAVVIGKCDGKALGVVSLSHCKVLKTYPTWQDYDNAQPIQAPPPKQEPTPPEPMDVRVEVVETKQVHVVFYDRYERFLHGDSEGVLIKLRITNTRQTKKIDYTSWAVPGVLTKAVLKDEFDNRYKMFGCDRQIVYGYSNGQEILSFADGSIHPGFARTDYVLFEKPIGKAKSLRLMLPKSYYGE